MSKKPVERPAVEPPASRWMQVLDAALAEAESNPELFIQNVKRKGKQAIATAREVRRMIKEDPEKPVEAIRNGVVQGLARRLRREIFGG